MVLRELTGRVISIGESFCPRVWSTDSLIRFLRHEWRQILASVHGRLWENLALFLGQVGTGSRITLDGEVRTATFHMQIVPALVARRNKVPVVCNPYTCRKTCSADPLSTVIARLHDERLHRTRTGRNPCTLALTAKRSFACRVVTDRVIMAVVMVTRPTVLPFKFACQRRMSACVNKRLAKRRSFQEGEGYRYGPQLESPRAY